MKFSEMPEDQRNWRINSINNRYKQLSELEKDSGQAALQYLFLTNSGGAATTLAFIGSIGMGKIGCLVYISLIFFVIGLILVGFSRAKEFYHMKGLFDQWRELTDDYITGKKDWEEVVKADKAKCVADKSVYWLPKLSFIFFIFGVIIGAVGFLLPYLHICS